MPNAITSRAVSAWETLTARLRAVGDTLPPLIMRIVMGWEFFEAGREKLGGTNWFTDIHDKFPVPFNLVPANFSWGIATWFELIGGIALWIGLGTRFFAFSLLVLTFVATAAVHWPDMFSMWSDLLKGYSISDKGHGNFKLPLLFVVMLLPLVFNGAGKASVDHLLARVFAVDRDAPAIEDAYAWSLGAVVLGIPFLMLLPAVGFTLLVIAIALALFGRYARA